LTDFPALLYTKTLYIQESLLNQQERLMKKDVRYKVLAFILAIIIIMSAFAVAFLWPRDEPPESQLVKQPEYHEDLVSVSVGNDTIVYTYDSDPGELNYTTGDYIVGTTGDGYLRRITDMRQDGRQVFLTTVNAPLTEVVEDADVALDETLSFDNVSSGTRASFTLEIEVTLYEEGNSSVKVFGEVGFSSDLVFNMKIRDWRLSELEFYIENTLSFELGLTATHAITIEKEKEIWSKQLSRITFWIGWIPVVITPKIEFAVGAELELQASVTTSIEGSLTTRGGLRYKSGEWSLINDLERTWGFNPPELDLSAEATAYAVIPRMEFLLYGLTGPTIELKPYVKLHASLFENPWWTLSVGIEGSAGFTVEILDKELAEVSFTIFEFEWELAHAPLSTEPEAPQALVAVDGDGYVNLSWEPPPDDGGSSVTGYNIYRGTVSGNLVLLAPVGDVLIYNNTGLPNGYTFYYSVSAVNVVGEGPKSNEASGRPLGVPTTPQNLVATPGDTTVNLTWQAPASSGGTPITNYLVYRGTTPGGETLLATLGNVLLYNDTGLINDQVYYYRVSAVNAVGEGPQSVLASAIPLVFTTIPTAPQNLTATPGDTTVNLTWLAPLTNGGKPVTNYKIYRGTTPGGETLLTTISTMYYYNDTGLLRDQTYYYRVSAVNANGESPLSNEVSAIPAPPVHNVDTDEYFYTIQDAINDSDTLDGHILEVLPGTYGENVQVTKQLTIKGSGRGLTFINGGIGAYVFEITANWVNLTDFTLYNAMNKSGRGVYVLNSNNCSIENNTLFGFGLGIYLNQAHNNTISHNLVIDNVDGIYLRDSNGNIITHNNASNNNWYGESDGEWTWQGSGIALYMSHENIISHNTAADNPDGICLCGSSRNTVTFNNASMNNLFNPQTGQWTGYGILLSFATLAATVHNNTITNNTIGYNNMGMRITSNSINNGIHHNNFLNNTDQGWDDGPNQWDNGYPSGGNYWGDHAGVDNFHGVNQDIPGPDGIGDSPYAIPGGSNEDRYPLMNPVQD